MVGRRSFPIRKATFQGRTVKLREGSGFVYPVSWSQRLKKRFTATKNQAFAPKKSHALEDRLQVLPTPQAKSLSHSAAKEWSGVPL